MNKLAPVGDFPYPHSQVTRDSRARHLQYIRELRAAASSPRPLEEQGEALERLIADRIVYAATRMKNK